MRVWGILLVFFCWSCKEEKPPKEVSRGIYYWKSNFKLNASEKEILEKCKVEKLYIKAFDLDWDFVKKRAIPKASIRFEDSVSKKTALIPTIFITNQVIKQITDNELDTTTFFIKKHLESTFKGKPYNEIQFDCDWTISTREKYFSLLRLLTKRFADKHLSATIRLHQIKFAHKTGIPPVERGMLMFYNMSNWKKAQIKNSIYDLDAASQYLSTLDDYPLPLDLVMPIFRWAIVYRGEKLLTVINNLDSEILSKLNFFSQKENKYWVQEDTSAFGISLRKGDMIRVEEVPFEELLKGSRTLHNKISTQKLTFALYHLDQPNITFYGNEELSQIYASFE
ncbi:MULTISPECIES: hypothetical protein [Emticicia]|uniref:hypothetical protein n=1 Tax=Emticicia TaxID=312278 RepID=UPI0007D8A889|nr:MULTISPECIES: hypothetical protein [Emticicia]